MDLNQKSLFKLKEGVICEQVDQDMILFFPETNCIINLNRTASRICELLKTKTSFNSLIDSFYGQLADEGKPDKSVIEDDVRKILEKLENNELLAIFESLQ